MRKGQPNAWQQSAQWRAISRGAIRKWNAQRASMPKCGAKRKRDGEPCQQLAKENGRCFFHGGRTGKGAEYHVHLFPNGASPDAEAKLQRKLKQIERDRKAQAKRRAKMLPEERKAHERWHRSHQPGSAAERARKRADRKAAAHIRESLEGTKEPPASPELMAVQVERKRIEAERDAFLNSMENRGVFG